MLRVGINGFGRIGRVLFRINEASRVFDVVSINDLDPDIENHAYLLKYDSTYGRFDGDVVGELSPTRLMVNGRSIYVHAEASIRDVPWAEYGVDVIVDASGVYSNVEQARELVSSGAARKVVITHSPNNGVDHTIIMGANGKAYDSSRHHVVSTSICDANAIAPVIRALEEAVGIESGFITTLHPWLTYQNLLDGSVRSVANPGHLWSDFTLGRASTASLIPKNTTLVAALSRVIPDVSSRLDAMSFRVPTGIVSSADMSLNLEEPVDAQAINDILMESAERFPEILRVNSEPLVSVDFQGTTYSATVDARWTRARGSFVKLILWYDNEWGYSSRVVDTVRLVGER